jgi:hypothetical protein
MHYVEPIVFVVPRDGLTFKVTVVELFLLIYRFNALLAVF